MSGRRVQGRRSRSPCDGPQGRPRHGSAALDGPLRLYLGLDEWGTHRWAPLPGLTGITVAGLPGAGKTSEVLSWLCQLARLPVVFVFIDGKGGGDYADWHPRAWLNTGDSLADAAGALEDVHALMRSRFAAVEQITGHRNAWHAGPTPAFPLIVTVIDECHTFFDLDAAKGQRDAEALVRSCRALTGQLVKKGRSVLMLTILHQHRPRERARETPVPVHPPPGHPRPAEAEAVPADHRPRLDHPGREDLPAVDVPHPHPRQLRQSRRRRHAPRPCHL